MRRKTWRFVAPPSIEATAVKLCDLSAFSDGSYCNSSSNLCNVRVVAINCALNDSTLSSITLESSNAIGMMRMWQEFYITHLMYSNTLRQSTCRTMELLRLRFFISRWLSYALIHVPENRSTKRSLRVSNLPEVSILHRAMRTLNATGYPDPNARNSKSHSRMQVMLEGRTPGIFYERSRKLLRQKSPLMPLQSSSSSSSSESSNDSIASLIYCAACNCPLVLSLCLIRRIETYLCVEIQRRRECSNAGSAIA